MSEIPFLTYHAIGIGQFYNFYNKAWSVVCDATEYSKSAPGKRLELSWREIGVSEMLSWT